MKRGEVTAFLSLIIVLIISFIAAMLESTVIQTSKNEKRLDVDGALFSIFGEYDKALLEKYELMAIDASYGTKTFREDNLIDRMRYYGSSEVEHEIQGIQYLTDNRGSTFREQALDYMEQTYGIDIIRNLAGMTGAWEEQEVQGEEAGKEGSEINAKLEDMLEEGEGMLPAEDNPLPNIDNLKKSNLLRQILPSDYELSGKRIEANEQPGNRVLRSGRGSFYIRNGMDGIEEKLLFHEYLLKKFDNAVVAETVTDSNTVTGENIAGGVNIDMEAKAAHAGKTGDTEIKGSNKSLSYEIEYMLSEKYSDEENLDAVAKKLLAIRFGLNYLYLQTDTSKQAEAEALALTLSTIAALPAISSIVKQVLIAAWAFGESIIDLRALMAGKKTALVKNSESWQLSLSSLMTLGTGEDKQEGMDAKGGITYKDYLRILLFLKDENTLTMKALDRVEQNMRLEEGIPSFRVDSCVVKLRVNNKAAIREGLTYQFPAYFGYAAL